MIVAAKEKKSVQFNEEVEVKEVEAMPDVVDIDEVKSLLVVISMTHNNAG